MKKSLFVAAAVVVASNVISLTNSPAIFAAEEYEQYCKNPTVSRDTRTKRLNEFILLVADQQDPEIKDALIKYQNFQLKNQCTEEEMTKVFEGAQKIADEIIGRREAEAEARRQAEEDAKREAEEEAERERLLEEEAKKLAEEEAKKETEEKTEEKAEETTETPAEIAEEIAAASEIQAPNTGFEVKKFAAQIAGFFSFLAAATFAFIRKK